MPTKTRPDDWDRLFAPNAPRRGGPLRALGNVILTMVLLGLMGGGAMFFMSYRQTQAATVAATRAAFQTNVAPSLTAAAGPTATIAAQMTATRFTIQTATAAAARGTVAPTPAPEQPAAALGVGVVLAGGNLRSEPRIADDTVLGLIWPGDQLEFIEQRTVDGQEWFHVRVAEPAADRAGAGVSPGVDGWAAGSLLSPPTPVAQP